MSLTRRQKTDAWRGVGDFVIVKKRPSSPPEGDGEYGGEEGVTRAASGVLTIKRLAYKIGENEWADTAMVADDVQVKFKLALSGVGKF